LAYFAAEVEPIWRPWAHHPPPSGIRPIFFDVDVHQLGWALTLVALGRVPGGPDQSAGERIERAQPEQVVTAQHAAHGPGWHTQFAAEPFRAAAVLKRSRDDIGVALPVDGGYTAR